MRTGSKRYIKTDGLTDEWNGFPVEVLTIYQTGDAWMQPLVDRPDGFGRNKFYWAVNDLVKRPPEGSNYEQV